MATLVLNSVLGVCICFVLVRAKGHASPGITLQGKPYEHEGKQQSGEADFHETG